MWLLCRSGRKNCCSSETLHKIHLCFQVDRFPTLVHKQVDFRNPSIGDICNFVWYLFNDLNRCPSTIEGYRTAIEDTLSNTKQNISTNTEIARLIASFHRDKPKHSRPIPKWNLSLVLQRLTQEEPQEKAALKFLTWKTVFLLALASGKRRSEIHAWKFCYTKVDNADMDLVGVKAHDIRAFAASKAFYGGISMDQIMQACHWK